MHYKSHLQKSENQTSSQKADHRTGVIADLRLQSSQKKNLMAGVFPWTLQNFAEHLRSIK